MLHKFFALFFITAFPFLGGLFVSCKAPKRAMHKTDGDLTENTTDTSRKQADKRNSPLTDDNEGDGGENAY